MPEPRDPVDPFAGFNFLVDIEGVLAGFSEVSGLTTETDAVEYRNGDEKENHVRKLPGLNKYTNIVLKRGYTDNTDLWTWRKEVLEGKTKRRDGEIVLRDVDGTEVLRWGFQAAWPSKWEGPALNAKNSEVAIESLELTVEKIFLKE